MSEKEDSNEYEFYIIHNSIGVSHIFRRQKGVYTSIKHENYDQVPTYVRRYANQFSASV